MFKKSMVLLVLFCTLSAHTYADDFDEQRAFHRQTSDIAGKPELLFQRAQAAENQVKQYTVKLEKNHQYGIYANCHASECGRLRLSLYRGNELVRAESDDNLPQLTFIPEQNGEYSVRVRLLECQTSQCAYFVQVVEELAH